MKYEWKNRQYSYIELSFIIFMSPERKVYSKERVLEHFTKRRYNLDSRIIIHIDLSDFNSKRSLEMVLKFCICKLVKINIMYKKKFIYRSFHFSNKKSFSLVLLNYNRINYKMLPKQLFRFQRIRMQIPLLVYYLYNS